MFVSDEEVLIIWVFAERRLSSRISPRAERYKSLCLLWAKRLSVHQEVPGFDRVAEIIGNCRSDLLGEIGGVP